MLPVASRVQVQAAATGSDHGLCIPTTLPPILGTMRSSTSYARTQKPLSCSTSMPTADKSCGSLGAARISAAIWKIGVEWRSTAPSLVLSTVMARSGRLRFLLASLASGRTAEADVFSAVSAIPPPTNPLNSLKPEPTLHPKPRTQNPSLAPPGRLEFMLTSSTLALDLSSTPPKRLAMLEPSLSSLHRESHPLAAVIASLP